MDLSELNHPKFSKPLIKDMQRFTKGEEKDYHGGTHGGLGNFQKKSKNNNKKSKEYYLATRKSFQEYFALEIYRALGFPTPKARYLKSKEGEIIIATKAIEGFIPLQAYVDWWPQSRLMKLSAEVIETISTYKLDAENQVVVNINNKKTSKISGNLFCLDIIDALLTDRDISGEGTNIALVAKDNRFRAYFIDKEAVAFMKVENHENLFKNINKSLDKLYCNKTGEQELAVYYALQQLIEPNTKTGISKLEKIFFNQRTASIYETFIPNLFEQHFRDVINAIFPQLCSTNNDPLLDELELQLLSSLKITAPNYPLNTMKACKNYLQELENTIPILFKQVIESNPVYQNLKQDLTHKNQAPTHLQTLDAFFYSIYQQKQAFHGRIKYFNAHIPFDPIVMYESINNNAKLLIDNALKDDANALNDFKEREELRLQIINVIQNQHPELELTKTQISDIVEDLRGPYYQKHFTHPPLISQQDLENQALFDQIYKPKDPEREALKTQLNAYIQRIQNNKTFDHGFRFFKTTQTFNRRANFHLATQLVKQLEKDDQSIAMIFDPENIIQLRQEFFETNNLFAKVASMNFLGWGINSKQLNGIIQYAETILSNNSTEIRLA